VLAFIPRDDRPPCYPQLLAYVKCAHWPKRVAIILIQPPRVFTEISLTSPKGLLWIGTEESDARALDELTTRNSEGLPLSQRIDAAQCKQILSDLRDEVIRAGV
jgi:hypothetical protein